MKKYTLLFLIIFSCSKDDNQLQQENFVKLETNTVEIQPNVSVTNITDNSITINTSNNSLEELKAGDVIVSGSTTDNPNGYARKIISAHNNGNEVVLETLQAKINEVFEEININTNLKIDYSQEPIINASFNDFGNNNFGRTQTDSTFYDKLKFSYNASTNKYEYEVEFKKDVASNLDGKISFEGSFQIEDEGSQFIYNVRPYTEKVFLIENRMKVVMENTIKASGALNASKKTFELAKIPMTFSLPTSLVVNIYLVMRIGVSGEISAEFSVENTITLTTDQSLSYTEDNGWLALGESDLSSETGFEGQFKLGIKSYFEPGVKIVFEQFRGINAGIYVENYLKFNAELNNDLNINWDLGYGIKVKGEAKVKFLDDNFINEDYELIFWEKPYTKFTEGTFVVPQKTFEGDVLLTTQQEVNDFGTENYTIINGGLTIAQNTTDLTNLNTITTINGGLLISDNSNLTNLQGLENIRKIGDFLYIHRNSSLVNYCAIKPLLETNGLLGIYFVGGYDILGNPYHNAYDPTIQDIINGNCSQ